MYTFYLGSRPCVVLSGYQVLKETLIDKAEEFSGRGDFPAVQMWSKGNGEAQAEAAASGYRVKETSAMEKPMAYQHAGSIYSLWLIAIDQPHHLC